jgi:DNA polymerase-3 subunit alpha
VYQEQVMQIAQVLAGYSLGQADLLRRAMGKKKADVMAKEKAGFLQGAHKNGVDAKVADEVFELMAFFAGYGFNRSHSAAYAVVTYQTGYLKCHFPHEFMAGLLSCDKDNTDNIVKFIAEARAMGIQIERPDVNESASDFTVVEVGGKKVVRFGLGAVKGVGEGAVEVILEARKQAQGAFSSLYDFCRLVDTQKVNRRVLEALVKAGAFDSTGKAACANRAQMFAALDTALERAAQDQRDRKSGQTSLLGLLAVAPKSGSLPEPEAYPALEEWNPKELLAYEKESLGFYITGHPLDRFQADIARYATANTGDLEPHAGKDHEVKIGGVVTEYRERPTKSGVGRVAFFNLEDPYGKVEVVVFPKTFEKLQPILTLDEPLLCTGRVKDEGEGGEHDFRYFLEEATPLSRVREEKTRQVHISLNADVVTPRQVEDLKALLVLHKGTCHTFLHLKIPMRSETVFPLGSDFSVAPTDELLLRLERLFGPRVVTLA